MIYRNGRPVLEKNQTPTLASEGAASAQWVRDRGFAGGAHLSLSHRRLCTISLRQGLVLSLDAKAVVPLAGATLRLASMRDRKGKLGPSCSRAFVTY